MGLGGKLLKCVFSTTFYQCDVLFKKNDIDCEYKCSIYYVHCRKAGKQRQKYMQKNITHNSASRDKSLSILSHNQLLFLVIILTISVQLCKCVYVCVCIYIQFSQYIYINIYSYILIYSIGIYNIYFSVYNIYMLVHIHMSLSCMLHHNLRTLKFLKYIQELREYGTCVCTYF